MIDVTEIQENEKKKKPKRKAVDFFIDSIVDILERR